jgi:hypothetical protein
MQQELKIYNTGEELILAFLEDTPLRWLEVTTICDGGNNQRLYGLELFLYEQPEINIQSIEKQFIGFNNIEFYDGLLYVHLRQKDPSFVRDFGFGREGKVGLTQQGLLCGVRLAWKELGASIPFVDVQKALSELDCWDIGQLKW